MKSSESIVGRRLSSIWGWWLHPPVAPVPRDANVEQIEIEYTDREIALGGMHQPWWVYYAAHVLILGWAVAATFGVKF